MAVPEHLGQVGVHYGLLGPVQTAWSQLVAEDVGQGDWERVLVTGVGYPGVLSWRFWAQVV